MKSANELRSDIYQKYRFTAEEIAAGEKRFAALKTDDDRQQFAHLLYSVYKIDWQKGGDYTISDTNGGISNATHVAIINAALSEDAQPKFDLAGKLFLTMNSHPVKGPQVFYELTKWWIGFEKDPFIKNELLYSLLFYTMVNNEAKNLVLAQMDNNLVVAKVDKNKVAKYLLNWLEYGYSHRGFDREFAVEVWNKIGTVFDLSRYAEEVVKVKQNLLLPLTKAEQQTAEIMRMRQIEEDQIDRHGH